MSSCKKLKSFSRVLIASSDGKVGNNENKKRKEKKKYYKSKQNIKNRAYCKTTVTLYENDVSYNSVAPSPRYSLFLFMIKVCNM